MGNEWEQDPQQLPPQPGKGQPNQDDIDRRLEELKRTLAQGATEAQLRIKRVAEKASEYWQQAQTVNVPRQASTEEEQRIR